MENAKKCFECKESGPSKFRQLKDETWKEIQSKGLVREGWSERMMLCNRCYMNHVSNPLKRGNKVTNKEFLEATEIEITETETEEIDIFNNFGLVEAIRSMAKILYNREVKEKQKPIYNFDELRELLENQDFNLGCFF